MSEYKSAKEAFVSDNPGASTWSINVLSLAAFTSYTLYAVSVRHFRPNPFLDYLTTGLPLLIAVTISSTHPYILNLTIVVVVYLIYTITPGPRLALDQNGHGAHETDTMRSKGKWLDESDSDEEPAEPVGISSSLDPGFNRRTSGVSISSTSTSPTSSPIEAPVATLSPILAEGTSKRTWKRRHSPTPSTHTHTAIDILSTPLLDRMPSINSSRAASPTPGHGITESGGNDKMPFLSVYRAHMMIMTVHCILAVDFTVFPRWQGKCEDFGTSLMDVGVGSFVFSLGVVSVRSLTQPEHGSSVIQSAIQALRKSAAILALGLVRVVMVKGSDYPEHVTEYGVHWNFFFTLGLLPVFGAFLAPIRRKGLGWALLALIVAAFHQLALRRLGLQSWILSPSRVGLIGMNKEGLVSLPGYLAIYLLGLATGQHVLRGLEKRHVEHVRTSETEQEHAKTRSEKRRTELALELFGYAVGWWVLLGSWRVLGGEVSRRMANLPYILWIAAYNTTFLLGYLIIELALFSTPTPRHAVPLLLDAINQNGLVVFIVANLMTGLVNVSMETMYVGEGMAMGVLVGYSVVVCGLAWVIRGVRLKL